MNAEASAIEHDLRRPIFTAFHGSVSIAVALFAIASSFVSTMASTFATSLLSVAVLSLAWLMVYHSVPARVITPGKGRRPIQPAVKASPDHHGACRWAFGGRRNLNPVLVGEIAE